MNTLRKPLVMICDDDSLFHLAVKQTLKGRFDLKSAYNTDEALAIMKTQAVDAVFMDIRMRTPEEGLQGIPKLLALDPDVAIIMSSGNTDFDSVKKAVDLGAAGYVPKDFDPEELGQTLDQILALRRLAQRNQQQNYEALAFQKQHVLIGKSKPIQDLLRTIEKFKLSSANVLIQGETGSGKEVVARLMRKIRNDGQLEPFVAIDSSTIQASTAESTLFGHEKGAFTGADRANKGLFEEANGGIVYFDEIGNMPLEIQAKLLRVLQEKEVTRMGSSRPLALEFRVIAATNRDLEEEVKKGNFKEDLLQRINVLPIRVPPLREHPEDIESLITHFLAKQGALGVGIEVEEPVRRALESYPWPGNVRELSNLIAYLCAICDDRTLRLGDLPAKLRSHAPTAPLADLDSAGSFKDRMRVAERQVLQAEFRRCDGNVTRMAEVLDVDRSHLHTKLKEHGLISPRKA